MKDSENAARFDGSIAPVPFNQGTYLIIFSNLIHTKFILKAYNSEIILCISRFVYQEDESWILF